MIKIVNNKNDLYKDQQSKLHLKKFYNFLSYDKNRMYKCPTKKKNGRIA